MFCGDDGVAMWRTLWLALGLSVAQVGFASEWKEAAPPVEMSAPPDVPMGWETQMAPWLRLHAPPGHTALLLRLAQHASVKLPELTEQLGVPVGDTIHVFVADDDLWFRDMQPGRPPEWADATAWPERGTIFLRSTAARPGTARPIEQVFTHELVHILLGRAFAPSEPPQWLQEGLARVVAGESAPEDGARLAGTTPPFLLELTRGFPSDPVAAERAYLASAHFVQFLARLGGPGTWKRLVGGLAAGEPIELAVHRATSVTLAEAETAWRRELSQSPSISWLNENLLFGVGGLALLVGGVLRRRRLHRRLAAMGEAEARIDALLAEPTTEENSLRPRSTDGP